MDEFFLMVAESEISPKDGSMLAIVFLIITGALLFVSIVIIVIGLFGKQKQIETNKWDANKSSKG